MSTTELQHELIKKIQATTDEKILLEATRLLDIQVDLSEGPYELTEEMNQAIDEAQAQIKNGEFLSHKEANMEIEEWLEK